MVDSRDEHKIQNFNFNLAYQNFTVETAVVNHYVMVFDEYIWSLHD